MRWTRSKAKKGMNRPAARATDRPAGNDPADTGSATDLLLADVALQGATQLLRHGIERGLLGAKLPQGKALKQAKGLGFGGSLVHGAILRLATRSVPGAILVGGGLLAKALHDRRKRRKQAGASARARPRNGDEGGEEA